MNVFACAVRAKACPFFHSAHKGMLFLSQCAQRHALAFAVCTKACPFFRSAHKGMLLLFITTGTAAGRHPLVVCSNSCCLPRYPVSLIRLVILCPACPGILCVQAVRRVSVLTARLVTAENEMRSSLCMASTFSNMRGRGSVRPAAASCTLQEELSTKVTAHEVMELACLQRTTYIRNFVIVPHSYQCCGC